MLSELGCVCQRSSCVSAATDSQFHLSQLADPPPRVRLPLPSIPVPFLLCCLLSQVRWPHRWTKQKRVAEGNEPEYPRHLTELVHPRVDCLGWVESTPRPLTRVDSQGWQSRDSLACGAQRRLVCLRVLLLLRRCAVCVVSFSLSSARRLSRAELSCLLTEQSRAPRTQRQTDGQKGNRRDKSQQQCAHTLRHEACQCFSALPRRWTLRSKATDRFLRSLNCSHGANKREKGRKVVRKGRSGALLFSGFSFLKFCCLFPEFQRVLPRDCLVGTERGVTDTRSTQHSTAQRAHNRPANEARRRMKEGG
jgi:hypothetical protein